MPEQKTIEHRYSNYRQQTVVRFDFAYDVDLVEVVKQFKGIRRSQTMSCWYIPKIQFGLTKMLEIIRRNAWVDYTALKWVGKAKLCLNLELLRKMNSLPKILIKNKVRQILTLCNNLNHRCILSIVYVAALWRSQLINLKISDILSDRKQVQIENSQGTKNPYSLLSANLLNDLKDYFKVYWPQYGLFKVKLHGKPNSATSLTNVLIEACRLAGIKRRVRPHMLRHSFASHMLQQGVDLRYIQELLGHNSTKTTEIYTQLSTEAIGLVRNPPNDILGSDPFHLLFPHQFGLQRTTHCSSKREINITGI